MYDSYNLSNDTMNIIIYNITNCIKVTLLTHGEDVTPSFCSFFFWEIKYCLYKKSREKKTNTATHIRTLSLAI